MLVVPNVVLRPSFECRETRVMCQTPGRTQTGSVIGSPTLKQVNAPLGDTSGDAVFLHTQSTA